MYSELLTYDEVCKELYRDKQKIMTELKNSDTVKSSTRLKAELSNLVTKNKQLMSELTKLNGEFSDCVAKYNQAVEDYKMESEDFDGRKDDTEIESNEFEECRKELEKLKNTIRKLEQSILHIAKRSDEIATIIDTNTAEGKKKNKQFKQLQAGVDAEKKAAHEKIKELDEKRAEAGKDVDSKLRAMYDRISEVHMDPISNVSNGRCSGCNMTLPSSMLGKVSSGELIKCENCGRMILDIK